MKRRKLTFALLAATLAGNAQNIDNGSFETGNTNGWVLSGGTHDVTADFASAEQVDGTYCLRLSGNGATLTSGTNHHQRNVNQVSFVAKTTGESNGELYLTVNGTDYKDIRYVIRPHWCTYYLPFSHDGDVSITIRLASGETFLMDNFRIDDQNTTDFDVESSYTWNERFGEDWGWVAGDNDVSLDLPNDYRLWFFNDSFYGTHNWGTNVFTGERFLRNAMVMWHPWNYLFSRYAGEKDQTTRYFESIEPTTQEGVDNFYWVGDAFFTHDNLIQIYLVELLNSSGGATATGRSYIATLGYPSMEYIQTERQEAFCYGYETIVYDEDYIYLYKADNEGWSQSAHVARCSKLDILGKRGTWEFWNGSEWVKDIAQSRKVCDYDPSAVVKLQPGNYAMVYQPVLSREMRVAFAPAPEGPWTESKRIFMRPNDEKYWSYMPNIHQKLENGKYSISYSINCWEDWGPSFNDKYFYRQRYFQADLLGLSPYTKKDYAATLYQYGFFIGAGYSVPFGSYTTTQMRQWGILPDWVSSVKLEDGAQITLYTGDNFTGSSVTFTSDAWAGVGDEFNDKVRSFVVAPATGIDGTQGATVKVWPNPATDQIHVDGAAGQTVTLYDTAGRTLRRLQCRDDSETIAIADLPAGAYMVGTAGKHWKIQKAR